MATNKLVASPMQDHQPRKNVFADLRSPGTLAKWPIIGWILFIFGGLMFAALTYNLLAQGPLLQWDKALATTLPAIGLKSPVYVKWIMDAAYYIGGWGPIILGVLLAIYFIYKRYWQEFAMLTIGEVGSTLLFLSISNLIGRARPPTQIWIILKIPGFPSGHTLTGVAFFGLLAYWLTPKMQTAFWKVFVVAMAVFIVSYVGFSRIFTGAHYLTDVLAGVAVGIAWSGVIYTLIEIYYKKRRSQNVKKN
jgi:membrane-associated phospholipid phosphatase